VNPALQKQAAIAVLENIAFAFAGHAEHVEEALAPTAAENVAVPQSVQVALPVTILYFPATHAVHVAPFAPVNPALHEQAATTVLETDSFTFEGHSRQVDETLAPTVVEYVAVPQSVHVALPLVVLYFPATQAVHGPPSGPVNPALQVGTQALTDKLPLGEVVPAGQVKHLSDTAH
jgi:hypothetical protein